MIIMPPGTVLLTALCFLGTTVMGAHAYVTFSQNKTMFNHLTLDTNTGTLYLGATNYLYQLTEDLKLEKEPVQTGPVWDSKDCLPPVTTECAHVQNTNNHNKLLLVVPSQNELIVCGSVFQGICEKRLLGSIDDVLFRPERPVDSQYVAANDPNVTTVGLVGLSKDSTPLLFVGRGYTSKGVGGIPPITTRNLNAGAEPHSVFSYEETAKLAVVGRLSEYNHHFIKVFTHRSNVYFLFYRRDLKSPSREYKTYISRICPDDSHYYSYVELPLSCQTRDGLKAYNLLQAAYIAQPGEHLARGVLNTRGDVLFAVFSMWHAASGKVSEESGLCLYSMEHIDRLINRTRDICYTRDGKDEDKREVAYIEYDVKSNCVHLPNDTLEAYPCGSDHTPSPMASWEPLRETPVFESPYARLTSIAINVEEEHTIAFIGDSKGYLNKVYLGANNDTQQYAAVPTQLNSAVSVDLLFDLPQKNLYVMTQSTVTKVPLSECSQHTDCTSCLAARDPYCGWCVLHGKCSRRFECLRSGEKNQWLWAHDMNQQCLTVQTLSPANISKEEKRNIFLTIPDLPTLYQDESYSCFFEDFESRAVRTQSGVMCPSPDPSKAPVIKPGTDHVRVQLLLRFGDVVISTAEFTFYDCMAVAQLYKSAPCRGCVSSEWGCNWCIHQHVCTHKDTCEEGTIIRNKVEKNPAPDVFTPPVTVPEPEPTPEVIPTTPTPTTTVIISTPSPTPETSTTTTTESTTLPVVVTTPTPIPTTVPTTIIITTIVTTPEPTTAEPTTVMPTTEDLTPEVTTQPPTEVPTSVPTTIPTTLPEDVFTSPVVIDDEVLPTTPDSGEAEGIWTTESPTTPSDFTVPPLLPVPTVSDGERDITFAPTTLPPTSEDFTSAVPPHPATNETFLVPSVPDFPEDLETEVPYSEEPPTVVMVGSTKENLDHTEADDWVDLTNMDNDTSSFSASTILSGDGDVEGVSPQFPSIIEPDLDYQADSLGFAEFMIDTENNGGPYVGPEACPCVHSIHSPSLLPVNVERKITLVGKNFHHYQDPQWDYECVLILEGRGVITDAFVEMDPEDQSNYYITCQLHQYSYSALQPEFNALIYVQLEPEMRVDSYEDLHVILYNCSVGHSDCSRCQTADPKYNCVWCGGEHPSCMYQQSCTEKVEGTCPAPLIRNIEPLSGPVDGGTRITITGSNLGQKLEDIVDRVSVANIPCRVDFLKYEISSIIVCISGKSWTERPGHVLVEVPERLQGISSQVFTYQNPVLASFFPSRGPKCGGTRLTIIGSKLLTGRASDIQVLIGDIPCKIFSEIQENQLECLTGTSNITLDLRVTVLYGEQVFSFSDPLFTYTPDPNITSASPSKSYYSGGRVIMAYGQNLDVVQAPKIRVTVSPMERRKRRSPGRKRRIVPETECLEGSLCTVQQFEELCLINSSFLLLCKTPAIPPLHWNARVDVEFILDNLVFNFTVINSTPFSYVQDPVLRHLNAEDPAKPYRHKPGSVISVEGEDLDLAITKEEMVAMIGDGLCMVKTLTSNHLYCEPPEKQPSPRYPSKREGVDSLPEFTVQIGGIHLVLGKVQYDTESQLTFPLEAQISLGVGASFVALIVLIIVLIYRRKSKQALRDYKKVQIQLENLETSVRDRCKKEFTDLMTEMMDLTSDLVGTGIPFLDYKSYAERIFFPGHRQSPLHRDLDVPEGRRQTVEQGLIQLSNLLNSKLFLTKFIHTLESQRTFSARDRAYVASLLTVSLHGKLEYFTDILKTLLNDLVEQYVAKNPKLMLRRTETVVEKLLTNWMSICLYSFVRDSAGEPLYMLFRGIKHQVDKGPVDCVTGKAKYTLNDNRLLRDDVEYKTLTLNAIIQPSTGNALVEEEQGVPVKLLDCDTIMQVKEKILDQVFKGTPYCLRPNPESLDLEWRSGLAGHLILSDEDLTSVVQGSWKRINTLQHYKVPDAATVALVPRLSKHIHPENHDYIPGEKTPMLEDADEGGIKLWHLVKPTDEPELPKHRRGSLRDRERAKAIPEIYLTRLLSMKGTLQKFVDDLFQVILSTSRPVPLAVKYFFDLLDDQALHYGITDPETIHIWKTNSLPLRFWINIIKNPQFVCDVQTSDSVDAVLSVIAQTFMDSCTIADHKLGRDSPINKLLYARDIPRYKQMVERYYSDIRQTISASDQEMNSALAELSRNFSEELNSLVALHELYKYINKYYDQIITALEDDTTAQKMQLGYRLQQIAAAVENKVTDL
ncbi:PREDICTED: plexin-B1 isoform X2 [Nanorana parkeri]|uniref:plexin-B1 isoform X2 n=1 Tax=Nanorana parkeri TaxID=125878 RepID=UPI00085482E7|nr:PREDICTED: plexin-B1 isoform X2 [Nanorana parkeri]